MKKGLWNFPFGNRKGFILALDAAIAITIVFIFIAISAYYVGKANEDPLTRLQMIRAGSDIIAILDYEDVFETLTQTEIADQISAILPPVYEMRLRVNGTFPQEILTVETTNETSGRQFVVSGERNLVLYNETGNHYATVKYWMWLR
ncbi:MAG: hypothetical protein ISS23_02235 [Nanoarchaeota archaeon]|nr:hypothetical protein [Nanoarchaeota archaeon]